MKEIKLFGRELKTKEGKSFIAYSYTKDGKKFYKVKFKRTCKMTPNLSGYVLVEINENSVSIQNGKKLDNGKVTNDTIWIGEVKDFKEDKESNAKAIQDKQEKVNDLFD